MHCSYCGTAMCTMPRVVKYVRCTVPIIVPLQGSEMHNGRGVEKQPLNQVTDVQMKTAKNDSLR